LRLELREAAARVVQLAAPLALALGAVGGRLRAQLDLEGFALTPPFLAFPPDLRRRRGLGVRQQTAQMTDFLDLVSAAFASDRRPAVETKTILTDFCPLGCYRPIKNINLHAKFSQKSLILIKKVTRNLPK